MLSEVRTGPIVSSDGAVNPARSNREGGLIIAPSSGDYEEMALRGQLFQGANQGPGGTTTTVGLAATYTGLVISNPAGSNKNLILLSVGLSIVGAPAALSSLGLLGGYAVGGVTAHTTPLVPLNCFMNQTVATGSAKADAAATLVGSPVVLEMFGTIPITGATVQVVNPPFSGGNFDLKGKYVLPPGAYVGIYTSTVLTIIGSFLWAEKPV